MQIRLNQRPNMLENKTAVIFVVNFINYYTAYCCENGHDSYIFEDVYSALE